MHSRLVAVLMAAGAAVLPATARAAQPAPGAPGAVANWTAGNKEGFGTSTAEAGKDWPKLVWVVDVQDETNPVPISTFPIPAVDDFKGRGGRYGAHNR